MTRIIVVCEGPTEELFVRHVLGAHLGQQGTDISAMSISGIKHWDFVRKMLINHARKDNEVWVTTMLDFYGLKPSFPEQGNRIGDAAARVQRIESAMQLAFQDDQRLRRIRPHLCLHEFEALLLAEPTAFGVLPASDQAVRTLEQLVASQAPETINDGPTTAPSKRILAVLPRYTKTTDGLKVAQRIGLDTMRHRCPHFASWLSWLESPA